MPRIMVVDDDKAICSLLQDILKQEGYEAATFTNGDKALDFLKNKDNPIPDLIVVDVMMPEMDGYSLNAMLQADSRLKGIPVIVVTAMKRLRPFFEPTRKVAAFFDKPLDLKAFMGTVSSLLAARASGSGPRADARPGPTGPAS